MKWERRSNEDSYHLLIVEAAWDEIAADYNDIVARYAKIRLPGFRAGKVPRPVVEQRFRKEIIEDLSRMCAQRLGREAIREAETEVLGPLEVTDIECVKGRTFRVHVRFLPMPEITLPDLNSLTIIEDGIDPRDNLSHMLLELVRFEVPSELVREELGLDGLDGSSPRSGEWTAVENRIRLMLILKRIARQEGIDVDEADIQKRLAEKAKEFGSTKAVLQAELEKGGGMQRLRDMLLAERTLDYLIEKAVRTE